MTRILNLLSLRLRIMFRHPSFWVVYGLVAAMTVVLVGQLYGQVDRGMKIPVGIIDYDNTRFRSMSYRT